jgi:hypothetical protein
MKRNRLKQRKRLPMVGVSDVACSRVVATERREGAVTRYEERRPHRSDRAETGRREEGARAAMDGVAHDRRTKAGCR